VSEVKQALIKKLNLDEKSEFVFFD